MTASRADRARLLTSHDSAAATGVATATLRDWVRRGILTNHGSRQAALYDPVELVAAMDAVKPRRGADTPRIARGA